MNAYAIIEAAKNYSEKSMYWFEEMDKAEQENDIEWAAVATSFWTEAHAKANAMLEAYELITGIELHQYELTGRDFEENMRKHGILTPNAALAEL